MSRNLASNFYWQFPESTSGLMCTSSPWPTCFRYTPPDIFNSRASSSPNPKSITTRCTVNNSAFTVQKNNPMMDRFLKETVKDGHFTGLRMDKACHEKGTDKTKL